ncbi:unnamed protein product [Cuscuta campestris]|uniref:Uncharacterized protein n=1 Tax=Cuscuta campestris TaxID=132261 RepID=A0A484K5V4_9ASTE|nr:unnamed protein product [Cuscuta campestris]
MERMNPQNPLYLHGSDGPNTVSVEKLTGVSNYRRWRRSMEIALSSKRKLGFVKGSFVKEQADTAKAELWDTCNDTVIGWIMGSVSDSIKQTIMYMLTAREIWMYLESRYSVSNGSLKYKLNRELYSFKQGGATINDYYTAMRGMWEELESLDQLPTITTVGEDVTRFLEALEKQKEEKRLFQFLNGVDEVYGPQRSQLLMMTTLPSVEFACSSLQQEESQRCVLNPMKAPLESSAMYSKGATDPETCSACGVKGHPRERCWTVIGYPKWHPKHKALYKSREGGTGSSVGTSVGSGKNTNSNTGWFKNKKYGSQKVAANAQGGSSLGDNGEITVQQLEHLLRNLHNKPRSTVAGSDTEDELDSSFAGFAGMVSCLCVNAENVDWIIDSGASDHMTGDISHIENVVAVGNRLKINLPNGNTSDITHCGGVKLKNGLNLKKVLVVPEFKHNLLSVNKLVSSEDCKVDFYAGYCVIVDNVTQKVKGIGESRNGLYYLLNEDIKSVVRSLKHAERNSGRSVGSANTSSAKIRHGYVETEKMSETLIWHLRLGHAPMSKLNQIGVWDKNDINVERMCVTCPMGKLTKKPFPNSKCKVV